MRSLLHHPYMLEYAGLSEATAKSPLVFHHCPSKKKGHFTTSIDIPLIQTKKSGWNLVIGQNPGTQTVL
jgi:hypothetical protein